MENFVFLLKTYKADLIAANRLLSSFIEYNYDKIKIYVVAENNIKKKLIQHNTILFIDELLFDQKFFSKPEKNLNQGYLNQQIIKLSFWELGLSKSYFCIDSDAYFTKTFFLKDFHKNSKPIAFYSNENELVLDNKYYNFYLKNLIRYREIIKKDLDLKELNNPLNCHGNSTISEEVMRSFKKQILENQNLTYGDLILKAPIEFTWYFYWLQKKEIKQIKEIPFKIFHTPQQYFYSLIYSSLEDINRKYLGVLINSNWSKEMKILNYGDITLLLLIRILKDFIRSVILKKKWNG